MNPALRDALNAYARLPAEERPTNLARVAQAIPSLGSPVGAGYLSVWLGSGVEAGDEPEASARQILEAFIKWSRTLEIDGETEAPETDEHKMTGLQYMGQALVAHLARSLELRAEISASEDTLQELERVEPLSIGATWVLELLRKRSGALVAIEVARKHGFLLRYENIANCFHLFTLLQGALLPFLPEAGDPSEEVQAVARGELQEAAEDGAWWHYGHARNPSPELLDSVWGEESPDHISTIDGEQVVLLWPPVLASRTWDAGFFGPHLEAAPSRVIVDRELTEAEVEHWWSRLDLPEPKNPWWRFW